MSDRVARLLPFYYGYLMVPIAMVAQICTSPGQTFAVSAFMPAIRESLEISDGKMALAYMLGTLLAALPLSVVGPLSDRFGLRITTAAVGFGLAITCWLASCIQGFATLLLAFMLLRFLGQGSLTLLSGNMVSMWFQRKLGTVTACMSVGMAAAFALVPPSLLWSIDAYGWRETYLMVGGLVGASLLPLVVFLFRNSPEELGQYPDGASPQQADAQSIASDADVHNLPAHSVTLSEAVRHRTFWIMAGSLAVWAMVGTGVVFYALQIFARQNIPSSESQLLFATFSLAMLSMQVTGGVLADRLQLNYLMSAAFVSLTAGTVAIPLTTSAVHMHLFAVLFGAGQGLAMSVSATMWVRYYGRRHLGKIRGTVWCLTVAGSGCGPLVLGTISDLTQSYHGGLWLFVALLAPLSLLTLLATPPRSDVSLAG
ncbi:MFS transporter [Roseimaritima sediminicola]|uniref:MFS transporter n=1 Tax=Roseimaritima sediminicola TaxID=2662066 RepID=UPI001386D33D|nr:MFS transporter [Roseimaritima sediminicola]